MTTPEIARVLAQKIQFNTFGGNPVCSAGGLAVIRVLDKEKRQIHCAEVGSHMIHRLRDLQQKHDSNSFFMIFSLIAMFLQISKFLLFETKFKCTTYPLVRFSKLLSY